MIILIFALCCIVGTWISIGLIDLFRDVENKIIRDNPKYKKQVYITNMGHKTGVKYYE